MDHILRIIKFKQFCVDYKQIQKKKKNISTLLFIDNLPIYIIRFNEGIHL